MLGTIYGFLAGVFLMALAAAGIVTVFPNEAEPPGIVSILAIEVDADTLCHILVVDGVPVEGSAIIGCKAPR